MMRTSLLRPAALAATVAMVTCGMGMLRADAQAIARASAASDGNRATRAGSSDADLAFEHTAARRHDDLAAMETFRPGFSFWQHIFTIPDGFIAFGSAVDGRLLAVFPTAGD